MKSIIHPAVAAILLVSAFACCAFAGGEGDQRAKDKDVKTVKRYPQRTEMVEVTGSMIKRRVTVDVRGNVTELPLVIVDRNQIERSGSATLAGVLRKSSGVR